MRNQRFRVISDDVSAITRFSHELGISSVTAKILWARGIRSREQYRALTGSEEELSDPFLLPDMKAAVEAIRSFLRRGKRVRIYGDYDADGVTATAVMIRGLTHLGYGGQVDYYIPNRFDEGYGLNVEAVQEARRDGVDLLVTVDCGSSSPDAAQVARSLGVDLVITDHHGLPDRLPEALALVNPERMQEPDRLSGAGVALQVIRALSDSIVPEVLYGIAAIGTVADVVPLTGNNRLLVRRGLLALQHGDVPGVLHLLASELRDVHHLSADDLGFFVGPRLNAAGRMGNADPAVRLLLALSEDEATEASDSLRQANRERRQVEQAILAEAWDSLPWNQGRLPDFVVVGGDGWHPGVIGIVASRLKEALRRPVAVIAWNGLEGKGSARGVDGLHLLQHLRRSGEVFSKLGGHRGAAGFSLSRQSVEDLSRVFSENLPREVRNQQYFGPAIDAELGASAFTEEFLAELKQLEPFGHGFERPQFLIHGRVSEGWTMGQDAQHLGFALEERSIKAVAFQKGHLASSLRPGTLVRFHATLQWNHFRGVTRPEWHVHELERESLSHEMARRDAPFVWLRNRKISRGVSSGLSMGRENRPFFPKSAVPLPSWDGNRWECFGPWRKSPNGAG